MVFLFLAISALFTGGKSTTAEHKNRQLSLGQLLEIIRVTYKIKTLFFVSCDYHPSIATRHCSKLHYSYSGKAKALSWCNGYALLHNSKA